MVPIQSWYSIQASYLPKVVETQPTNPPMPELKAESVNGNPEEPQGPIWGIKKRRFFIIIALVLVVMVAAVAGAAPRTVKR